MKSLLCPAVFAAACLKAANAQTVSVASFDPATPLDGLCENGGPIDRAMLEMECGTVDVPCPVIVKKHTVEERAAVPCVGTTVQVQGLAVGSVGIATQTVIHGYVIAHDDTLVGESEFAITYPVLKALCPLPCDHGEGSFTCVAKPDECTDGGHLLEMPHVDQWGVIASFLSDQGPFSLRGEFVLDSEVGQEKPTFSAPVDEVNAVPYENPKHVAMMEITEGEGYDCGTLDPERLFTQAEAYEANGCGSLSEAPCPLAGKVADFLGQCYDPSEGATGNCIDVHFWMEGLTDPTGTYCGSAGTPADCPRIGAFSRRFKLVIDTTGGDTPFMDVPIGAWRDMCPFECATATTGGAASRVCAASSDVCVAALEDTPPRGVVNEWDYMVPGSATASIRYVSHTHVNCESEHSSSTTSTPTADMSTEDSPSGTSRAVVGGLTTLAIACGVLYM